MPRSPAVWLIVCLISVEGGEAHEDSTALHGKRTAVDAGLAVVLFNPADLVDYFNLGYTPTQRVDDFIDAAEFSGGISWVASASMMWNIEFAYLVHSGDVLANSGNLLPYSIRVYMPTLLTEYVVAYPDYYIVFGGGAGYHIGEFSLTIPPGDEANYRSTGLGLQIEAKGATEFDEHVFGVIAITMQKTFMRELRDANNQPLVIPNQNRNASLSSFSVGLKFGFQYFF